MLSVTGSEETTPARSLSFLHLHIWIQSLSQHADCPPTRHHVALLIVYTAQYHTQRIGSDLDADGRQKKRKYNKDVGCSTALTDRGLAPEQVLAMSQWSDG